MRTSILKEFLYQLTAGYWLSQAIAALLSTLALYAFGFSVPVLYYVAVCMPGFLLSLLFEYRQFNVARRIRLERSAGVTWSATEAAGNDKEVFREAVTICGAGVLVITLGLLSIAAVFPEVTGFRFQWPGARDYGWFPLGFALGGVTGALAGVLLAKMRTPLLALVPIVGTLIAFGLLLFFGSGEGALLGLSLLCAGLGLGSSTLVYFSWARPWSYRWTW